MTEKELLAQFTPAELEVVKAVAERDGVTLEQAARDLAHDEIRHRVKKDGHRKAKVYSLPKKA